MAEPDRADLPIPAESPISWAVMNLAHEQRGIAAARLAAFGLHAGQEIMLGQLWERDGRSQKELGELMGLDHSTVAKSVARLERAGLVARSRSHDDGRIVVVSLTDAGRALEAPVRQIWRDLEARWAERLTDADRDALRRILSSAGGRYPRPAPD
jgi:MarR family transcriptional regulator, organic hydroperoxide resistance regulator